MKFFKRLLPAVLTAVLPGACGKELPKGIQEDPSTYKPMEQLPLLCDYVYLIDPDTNQVLIDRGSQERMYPASMTKVMTSIIALEEIPDPENVTIEFTQEMLDGLIAASANRAGFLPGDKPTALDHIYGDLLPSGADCSRALAFYISGSEEAFVELMNQKARELGMNDTNFVNTSGLHDDNHYTTCRDMMKLYLYCMENEEFMEILKTQVHISVPVDHFPEGLGMTNFVLMYINQKNPPYQNYMIPGFVAGKSGYTTEGEYTLVSNAEENGMNLVMVNAHGYVEPHYPASIEDSATVYNWYKDHFARIIAIGEGESFGTIRVRNAFGRDASVNAVKGVTADLPKDENLHIYVDYPEVVEAPLKKGDKVGTVSVYSYDQLYETVDLVISEDKPVSLFGKFQTALYDYSGGRLWMGVLLVALILASLVCVLILIVLTREEKTHRIHRDRN